MPEENIPQNLPTEGESLLDNVKKSGEKPAALASSPQKEAEPVPKPMPQRPPTKEAKEAEDIFYDVKETAPTAPATQQPPIGAKPSEAGLEKEKEETVVETPHQGFKKVLITIGTIVVFAGILAGGGYWAYNNFLKPKPLSPLLNLTNTAPTQPTQPAQQVQPLDSDNDGLSNAEEKTLGTNPLSPDSDGDKLFDREEVKVYKTDPLVKDTDGDGYEDGAEVQAGYDPKGLGKLIKIPTSESEKKVKLTESSTIECSLLPNKLENCEKYICRFTHPFTNTKMKREIKGFIGDKCHYVEEMPNKGQMECKYSSSFRKVIARYYKDLIASESTTTSIKITEEKLEAKYTVDGKEVENPLQEALDNKQCIISGY